MVSKWNRVGKSKRSWCPFHKDECDQCAKLLFGFVLCDVDLLETLVSIRFLAFHICILSWRFNLTNFRSNKLAKYFTATETFLYLGITKFQKTIFSSFYLFWCNTKYLRFFFFSLTNILSREESPQSSFNETNIRVRQLIFFFYIWINSFKDFSFSANSRTIIWEKFRGSAHEEEGLCLQHFHHRRLFITCLWRKRVPGCYLVVSQNKMGKADEENHRQRPAIGTLLYILMIQNKFSIS